MSRITCELEALGEALQANGIALDHVLVLEVDDDLIVNRITGRRTDPETGEIYHLEFKPPPADVAPRKAAAVASRAASSSDIGVLRDSLDKFAL